MSPALTRVRLDGGIAGAHDRGMHITLDEPVFTTDGEFGELADVVADPTTATITHVVVQPHRRHYQARLVPVELVHPKDDGLYLDLDDEHVRMLQRVSDVEYVRSPWLPRRDQPGWDIGIEHVLTGPAYVPYSYALAVPFTYDWPTEVEYDRIPRGECEIALTSAVTTNDGHLVGHVDSFLVDRAHIDGVIVRTGIVGLRHRVAVPIGGIGQVRNDHIVLGIDRARFRALAPLPSHEFDAGRGRIERIEHALGSLVRRVRQRIVPAGTQRSRGGRPTDTGPDASPGDVDVG
jgi:sporulation protein YlmC with PRC-barrel domain